MEIGKNAGNSVDGGTAVADSDDRGARDDRDLNAEMAPETVKSINAHNEEIAERDNCRCDDEGNTRDHG